MSDEMCMAKRTPEHDRLNYYVGEWKTRETHYPSPWLPKGGTGEGRATARWAIGNLFLVTDYHSKGSMGGEFEGHSVDTWDPVNKVLKAWWFDSMSTGAMVMTGRFEGDDVVTHSEVETPEGKTRFRSISHRISQNEYEWTMEMEVGGKMTPTMKVHYVRT